MVGLPYGSSEPVRKYPPLVLGFWKPADRTGERDGPDERSFRATVTGASAWRAAPLATVSGSSRSCSYSRRTSDRTLPQIPIAAGPLAVGENPADPVFADLVRNPRTEDPFRPTAPIRTKYPNPVLVTGERMDRSLGSLWTRFGELRVFASARSRRRFAIHLLVAVVALAVVTILVRRHLAFLTDAPALRAFIRQYGFWAPLVLVVLQAVQVVVAPIPGQLLAVVAGYLFGAWWGTLYNVIGITIGSTVAFWLSRRFGRAYVEDIVHEEALATFDAISDDYARPTLLVLFLVPGLPDDALCFVGGLTAVPIRQLVVLAVVGRTPAFFLANVVGDLLGTDRIAEAVALAAVVLVLSVLGYLYRDRIVRLLGGEP